MSAARPQPARPRVQAPVRRRKAPNAFFVLVGLGLGIVIGITVNAESARAFSAPGGVAMELGRLAAMIGTYLLLVTVVLAGRLPVIERVLGHDRLIRWHRWLGPWPILLLTAHAVLTTLGYAQSERTGWARELWTFLTTYKGLLLAFVAFGLIVMAGVTSYRAVRRRMAHETWWVIHLYMYLALALSFTHQLANGQSFIGHPLSRLFWISLWVITAGVVLVYRIGSPLWRTLYHRLRVVQVKQEGNGVVSVVCKGHRLDRLPVAGGQFLHWRFLKPGMWWQAHPYSLSALPRPPHLRITVKDLGDHSRSLSRLKPGTWVAIEGPYGAFTAEARTGAGVLLVAAGVGSTPIRALLEDLPVGVDLTVILRASTPDDLVLRDEIATLVSNRRGRLHEVIGSRKKVRFDANTLHQLVPDLQHRDVYICGPAGFADMIVDSARKLGTPKSRIHREHFAF